MLRDAPGHQRACAAPRESSSTIAEASRNRMPSRPATALQKSARCVTDQRHRSRYEPSPRSRAKAVRLADSMSRLDGTQSGEGPPTVNAPGQRSGYLAPTASAASVKSSESLTPRESPTRPIMTNVAITAILRPPCAASRSRGSHPCGASAFAYMRVVAPSASAGLTEGRRDPDIGGSPIAGLRLRLLGDGDVQRYHENTPPAKGRQTPGCAATIASHAHRPRAG